MRVLDPCCGTRMMWFDCDNENVIFGDKRSETIVVTDRSHGKQDGTRTLQIEPDTLMDFRSLPFTDGIFRLVAFDQPHLVRAGPKSWLAAKYGKLSTTDWRDEGLTHWLVFLKQAKNNEVVLADHPSTAQRPLAAEQRQGGFCAGDVTGLIKRGER